VAHGTQQIGRRHVLTLFFAVALTVVAIDQVTKHLSVITLEGRESLRLLGGAVYLTLVRNSGAAFSMGTDYTYIFPIIAIAVTTGIVWVTWSVRSRPWALALGLVLGGASGNLVDRILRSPGPFRGHVVDMVSVFGDHGERFPVFNAADSALSIGVVLIILLELTGRHRDGSRTGRKSGAPGPRDGASEPADGAPGPGDGARASGDGADVSGPGVRD
jgi:signal peptidase II